MKFSAAVLGLGLASFTLAQTDAAGPSPTESVGCEPHGDHWHCEGPAETAAASAIDEVEAAGPSPTESVGCEPHGDHWHCEAHVSETGATASATEAHDHEEEDDHDHEHSDEEHSHEEHSDEEHSDEEHSDEDVEAAGPSPTESVGCEPHGDHWHCEGPAETAPAETEETPGATETPGAEEPEGGNAGLTNIVPLVGAIAAAAMAL
ncbi:uncharacterized protein J7T54_005666 [Emericellopsis cladophorae]|uniref:Uncharacterized protein n=1 Tax=Emericellopsis cladophorae TaxID=2686198 RepID=A0A9Q0BFM3_9HYPO|nr:uncharacterized protein J7T54_005666 [Emericellopsis cladophorae]KAI6783637.1 hypothetical protein J7T54_005666 [Emericellopsis cladophorae]